MSMQISLVPVEHIESVWHSVERYIADALSYYPGRYTVEDIKIGLLTEPRQLWLAFDGAVIYGVVGTHVVTYPRMRTLFMHFIGGDAGLTWKAPMLVVLQKFARDNDCKLLEAQGRTGWKKIFESDGLKTRSICFDIPVE